MAKPLPPEQLEEVIKALRNFRHGASLAEVCAALAPPQPDRSVYRWLEALADANRVIKTGKFRSTRYALAPSEWALPVDPPAIQNDVAPASEPKIEAGARSQDGRSQEATPVGIQTSVDRSTIKPVDRSNGGSVDRTDQAIDGSTDRQINRSTGTPLSVDQSTSGSVDRADEQVDRSTDQPLSDRADEPVNGSTGQPTASSESPSAIRPASSDSIPTAGGRRKSSLFRVGVLCAVAGIVGGVAWYVALKETGVRSQGTGTETLKSRNADTLTSRAPEQAAGGKEQGSESGVRSQDGRSQEATPVGMQNPESSIQQAGKGSAGLQPAAESTANVGAVLPARDSVPSAGLSVGGVPSPRDSASTNNAAATNQSTGKPVDQSTIKPVDQSTGGSVDRPDQPIDRSTGSPSSVDQSAQPVDRSTVQQINRSTGTPLSVDRSNGGSVVQPDQPVDRSTGTPSSVERTDQPINGSTDRPINRSTGTLPAAVPSQRQAAAILPPYPSEPGAYVLSNRRWVPLPRNNDRVIAHAPTLKESDDYLQWLDDYQARRTKEKPMLVTANLTFDGKEPVPVVPAKDVTIVYVGLLAPPRPEIIAPYPELKDYPLIELAITTPAAKGARQAPLFLLAPNLIGFGPKRIPAIEERVAPDITILRSTGLPPGRYALFCGPQSYEVAVQ